MESPDIVVKGQCREMAHVRLTRLALLTLFLLSLFLRERRKKGEKKTNMRMAVSAVRLSASDRSSANRYGEGASYWLDECQLSLTEWRYSAEQLLMLDP
jgi:hypothetical protein